MSRPPATSIVHLDNERVRVSEWRFEPGAATGWHRHELDYVIVPLMDGTLRLEGPESTTEASLEAGVSYFRSAGVEHDVINVGDHFYAFVEIELK